MLLYIVKFEPQHTPGCLYYSTTSIVIQTETIPIPNGSDQLHLQPPHMTRYHDILFTELHV